MQGRELVKQSKERNAMNAKEYTEIKIMNFVEDFFRYNRKNDKLTTNEKEITIHKNDKFVFVDVIVDRPLFNTPAMDEDFEGSISAKVEMNRFRCKIENKECVFRFLLSM